MNKPKICKGCIYGKVYYGDKDKQGKPIPSNFICAIRKNAQPIPLTLKKCEFKKVKRV